MRYRKTAAGQMIVANRGQELDQKLRSLLVIINPALIEAKIQQMVTALRLPVDALQTLLQRGFIEGVPGTENEAASSRASDTSAPDAPAPAPGRSDAAATPAAPAVPALSSSEFERFRSAVGLISEIASRHLGWRAFTFQLKIERAATLEDIRPLTAELKELLRKVKKESEAAEEVMALDLLLN